MSILERERVEEIVVPREILVPREVTKRDVLHRAADLLEEFGWCQHSLGGRGRGEFCALGALHRADADLHGYDIPESADGVMDLPPSLRSETYISLCDVLPRHGVSTWNNDPGRTKAEVVAKLREAAESAS